MADPVCLWSTRHVCLQSLTLRFSCPFLFCLWLSGVSTLRQRCSVRVSCGPQTFTLSPHLPSRCVRPVKTHLLVVQSSAFTTTSPACSYTVPLPDIELICVWVCNTESTLSTIPTHLYATNRFIMGYVAKFSYQGGCDITQTVFNCVYAPLDFLDVVAEEIIDI